MNFSQMYYARSSLLEGFSSDGFDVALCDPVLVVVHAYLIFLGGTNPALDASSIVLKQISGLVLLYQEEYFV